MKRTFNGTNVVDNLVYNITANSNKVANITETGTNPAAPNEFFGTSSTYTYDANGNLLTDTGKGITNIVYNYLNLPNEITKSGLAIKYKYAADGNKLRANFGTGKVYNYVAGLVYVNDSLEFIPTAEGRLLPPQRAVNPQLNGSTAAPAGLKNTFYRYEYQINDHLGNLRVACRCGEKSGATTPGDAYAPIVVQENHYDPWGLSLPLNADTEKVGGSPTDRFKFIGRESQRETNWIDLQARFYDPQIGRFLAVDLLAEKREWLSPYNYAQNNPIVRVDPTGALDEPWYRKAANWISNTLKGSDTGTKQRYQTEPPRGATVTGIRDTQGGKVRNGSPVGIDVFRVDNPHGSLKTAHINVNPAVSGVPDPHTPISTTALKGLGAAGKTLDALGKVAKPVAVVVDVARMGEAVQADGGRIGANTLTTGASVAGGWAGAAIGASLGAKGGAMAGGAIGAFFGGVGAAPGAAVGGFVGGIGGGIGGAFGGSIAAETIANEVVKQKNE